LIVEFLLGERTLNRIVPAGELRGARAEDRTSGRKEEFSIVGAGRMKPNGQSRRS
jgi:hypothetical protein